MNDLILICYFDTGKYDKHHEIPVITVRYEPKNKSTIVSARIGQKFYEYSRIGNGVEIWSCYQTIGMYLRRLFLALIPDYSLSATPNWIYVNDNYKKLTSWKENMD